MSLFFQTGVVDLNSCHLIVFFRLDDSYLSSRLTSVDVFILSVFVRVLVLVGAAEYDLGTDIESLSKLVTRLTLK